MTNDSFSIRLREARQMMGLSMDKLVERTSGAITKQSISRYEKGIMRPRYQPLKMPSMLPTFFVKNGIVVMDLSPAS